MFKILSRAYTAYAAQNTADSTLVQVHSKHISDQMFDKVCFSTGNMLFLVQALSDSKICKTSA